MLKIPFLIYIGVVILPWVRSGVVQPDGGVSVVSRQQDDHGNYAFDYSIVDGLGASNSRSEVGDAYGNKVGSYSLTDIDGRVRRVDYVADEGGFRAKVQTNEPGTQTSEPADATILSSQDGVVTKTIVDAAPALVQYAYASPAYAPMAKLLNPVLPAKVFSPGQYHQAYASHPTYAAHYGPSGVYVKTAAVAPVASHHTKLVSEHLPYVHGYAPMAKLLAPTIPAKAFVSSSAPALAEYHTRPFAKIVSRPYEVPSIAVSHHSSAYELPPPAITGQHVKFAPVAHHVVGGPIPNGYAPMAKLLAPTVPAKAFVATSTFHSSKPQIASLVGHHANPYAVPLVYNKPTLLQEHVAYPGPVTEHHTKVVTQDVAPAVVAHHAAAPISYAAPIAEHHTKVVSQPVVPAVTVAHHARPIAAAYAAPVSQHHTKVVTQEVAPAVVAHHAQPVAYSSPVAEHHNKVISSHQYIPSLVAHHAGPIAYGAPVHPDPHTKIIQQDVGPAVVAHHTGHIGYGAPVAEHHTKVIQQQVAPAVVAHHTYGAPVAEHHTKVIQQGVAPAVVAHHAYGAPVAEHHTKVIQQGVAPAVVSHYKYDGPISYTKLTSQPAAPALVAEGPIVAYAAPAAEYHTKVISRPVVAHHGAPVSYGIPVTQHHTKVQPVTYGVPVVQHHGSRHFYAPMAKLLSPTVPAKAFIPTPTYSAIRPIYKAFRAPVYGIPGAEIVSQAYAEDYAPAVAHAFVSHGSKSPSNIVARAYAGPALKRPAKVVIRTFPAYSYGSIVDEAPRVPAIAKVVPYVKQPVARTPLYAAMGKLLSPSVPAHAYYALTVHHPPAKKVISPVVHEAKAVEPVSHYGASYHYVAEPEFINHHKSAYY